MPRYDWNTNQYLIKILDYDALYQGENKLIFHWDDDGVHFVLEQYAELNLYSASSLKQQSG